MKSRHQYKKKVGIKFDLPNVKIQLTESREDGCAPHQFSEDARDENEATHFGAKFVLEGVQHGDVFAFAEFLCKEDTTEEETERVSEGGLAPNQSFGEDLFSRGVDVSASDPGRCEREKSGIFSFRSRW